MLVTSRMSRDDPFVEGFRVLRTALEYSWPEATARTLLVTSTAPGEGKTITALNLALTLASLDQKVLLIDADLRKPKTHSVLKVKRTPGLTDVLVGRARPSTAIQQRVHDTRLDLLPAGTSVPSPADLLSGAAMPGLLDALRTHYRWIVIDTPPVGAVAEPLALAPHGRRHGGGGGRRDGAAQGGRAQPGAPGRDARPHPGRRAEPRAGREALLLLRPLLRLLRGRLRSRGTVRVVRKGGLDQCEARPRLERSSSRPAALLASCEDLPNIPPVASFIFSPVSPIVSGQSVVVFNASGSDDADGTVRSYTWEFGDGSGTVRADAAVDHARVSRHGRPPASRSSTPSC